MISQFRIRLAAVVAAALIASVSLVGSAEARIGGGGSFGSRGMRTWSAPPVTPTAPTQARPIERSMTQPGTQPGLNTARPVTAGGLFSGRGLLGGLAAGFLGAGLFGMLLGGGFWGGIGSFAGFLGFALQIILVFIVARLVLAWWQRRNQPAFAAAPTARPLNFGVGGLGSGGGFGAAQSSVPLTIEPDDYNAFERLLADVQTAYSNEDLAALRQHVTPEMLSYFAEDLSRNTSRGVVNKVSDVRLLNGDLAEAWREGDIDYATVAMRFSLVDRFVERASERLVEGSAQPQTVTELWTFTRARGGQWLLAAIQQS